MSGKLDGFAIVTHGGAGEPLAFTDGCEQAAHAGRAKFDAGGDALDAAIAAVLVLEEDARFNAGTGAVLCLDGATIEMDASVMDTRGRLGAVACVRDVRNPIRLARAVADTPHVLLCGIDLIDKDADTGLIAVTKTEAASCSNTHMPIAKIVH